MIIGKLTAKAQTTIPQAVRHALRLKPGDDIAYEIDGDAVILRKAEAPPADDPLACFTEWDDDLDTAYDAL